MSAEYVNIPFIPHFSPCLSLDQEFSRPKELAWGSRTFTLRGDSGMWDEIWEAGVYWPQKDPCPSLFCYMSLCMSVKWAKTKDMTALEASLEGCEETEMALPSEMPLAAHVLIKHQREHACFFPSVATAISSTSVWLSCFQVEHFHTRPTEELFICSQLSVFSKSRL